MTGLVESSIAQYAVIEARRTEGPSERFVIAYPDEESLREVIAADFRTAAASQQTSERPTVDGAEKYQRGVVSTKRRTGSGFNMTQTRGIVRAFLQAAVAGAILIFYSRNAVSAAIRSFVLG